MQLSALVTVKHHQIAQSASKVFSAMVVRDGEARTEHRYGHRLDSAASRGVTSQARIGAHRQRSGVMLLHVGFEEEHQRQGFLVLRREQPEDAYAVALAHIAAWQRGYAGILPDDAFTEDDPPSESYVEAWAQRRRQRLASPELALETLVAAVDGVIVGHITYGRSGTDTALPIGQVWSCYVHPENWGTGVADALMRVALDALPYREVGLWVLAGNHRARRFYHRHGFRPDGARRTHPLDTTSTGVPEVRYMLHHTPTMSAGGASGRRPPRGSIPGGEMEGEPARPAEASA
jgi:RimJ/RimL family protein N-acetyltransferase